MKRFLVGMATAGFLMATQAAAIAGVQDVGKEAMAPMAPALSLNNWMVTRSGKDSWRVVTGGTLQVEMESPLDSATANVGDTFQARLVEPLLSGGKVVAPAGSRVEGHVTAVDRSSRLLKADVPSHHWLDANGALGLQFDGIVGDGRQININAAPLPGSQIVRGNAGAQVCKLDVDKNGDVTVEYDGVKYGALDTAIGGASLAAGPVGLIAGPLMSGIAGAISPAMSYGRPTDEVEGHKRIKGFFLGMVRGLPGGTLVTEVKEHGVDVSLGAGDEITLQVIPASRPD